MQFDPDQSEHWVDEKCRMPHFLPRFPIKGDGFWASVTLPPDEDLP